VRLHGLHRDLFIGKQGNEVFACRTTCREDSGGFAAKVGNCAGNINTSASGFENRRATA
jgi:hypothetical protein